MLLRCVYSRLNVRMILTCSYPSTHRLPSATDFAFYPWVWVSFSQIKTWFKDLSTSDLVVSGKWKANADRPVAGLSAGVHHRQCSPCMLAFSLLTRQSEHLHLQLNACAFVAWLEIKSFKCSYNVIFLYISVVNPVMAQHII